MVYGTLNIPKGETDHLVFEKDQKKFEVSGQKKQNKTKQKGKQEIQSRKGSEFIIIK